MLGFTLYAKKCNTRLYLSLNFNCPIIKIRSCNTSFISGTLTELKAGAEITYCATWMNTNADIHRKRDKVTAVTESNKCIHQSNTPERRLSHRIQHPWDDDSFVSLQLLENSALCWTQADIASSTHHSWCCFRFQFCIFSGIKHTSCET